MRKKWVDVMTAVIFGALVGIATYLIVFAFLTGMAKADEVPDHRQVYLNHFCKDGDLLQLLLETPPGDDFKMLVQASQDTKACFFFSNQTPVGPFMADEVFAKVVAIDKTPDGGTVEKIVFVWKFYAVNNPELVVYSDMSPEGHDVILKSKILRPIGFPV